MYVAESPHATRGTLVPPALPAPFDPRELLAEVESAPVVRLVELRPRIGLTQAAQAHVIRSGLLETVPGRKRHEGYLITCDEARTLILATVLAAAAGMAIAAMLRGLKGAGVTGAIAAAALHSLP